MEDAISLALRQIKENLSQLKGEESPTSVSTTADKDGKPEEMTVESSERNSGSQVTEFEEVASHQHAIQSVQEAMADLIKQNDPLLYDLPTEVTLEEINSCIALEYGQAMVVNVRKADDEVMAVVVTQNATVLDLKHAIKRYVMLKQKRTGGKPHISWRYVWRRHWLYFEGQKLTQDNKALKEYGIRNKDEVSFMKRLKEK